jgi:hypothetical protein
MANTSIKTPNPLLEQALAGIPEKFRTRLISAFLDLKRNCAESRFDAAGIAAGKFCEVAIRILQNNILGKSTPLGTKIPNFADECRKIITASAPTATDSEKNIIPRSLVFLYTMRNKRGIGHVGGDVDANAIDISLIARVANWTICEFIRIYHGLSLEEAQDIVDGLAIRNIPDIWEVAGKKRVIRKGLKASDESLLLLYSSRDSAVMVEDLISWVEYSNPRIFKSNVLSKLHKERLVEWDRETETVYLSPTGATFVEDRLLNSS